MLYSIYYVKKCEVIKINSLKSIDLSRFKRYTFAITIKGENMQEDFILDNEIEEEDYICYHPTEDKKVFGISLIRMNMKFMFQKNTI